MSRQEFAKVLTRFLTRYDRFLLSGHVRPDGDAVGSATALALAIKEMGKEAIICFDGDPSRYTSQLAFVPSLPVEARVEDAGNYFKTGRNFAFIMLDCSEPARTGRCEGAIMAAQASLSIDHHAVMAESADFSYCEPETSSASQVLYGLFKECGIRVTAEMAKALFLGLAYDTGGFRHSNVDEESFRMAAEMRALGVDSSKLMNYLFFTSKFGEVKSFTAAVSHAKIHPGGILISGMTGADFAKIGINAKAADGVVGRLTEIKEARVVCFLREIEPGTIRVNMRSKCDVNVARIAGLFGGGGHVLAAGCTIQEPMLNVKNMLLEAIYRQMDELGMDRNIEE